MKRNFTMAGAFALMLMLIGAGCTATRTDRSTGEVVDDTAVTAKVKLSSSPAATVTSFQRIVRSPAL